MSLRYRFYNRYPKAETNGVCLWHRVNHPVPMTFLVPVGISTGTQSCYDVCLHPPPFPASSLYSPSMLH